MKERKHILMALSWYHPKLHQGIARFARENSWHLHSYMAMSRMVLPYGWQGDGVICSVAGDKEYNDFIDLLDCPKVYLGRGRRGDIYGAVSEDDILIGEMAAEYFMAKSFRNFAWYAPSLVVHELRRESYSIRLSVENHSCIQLIPPMELTSWADRHAWLMNELKQQKFPLAVFAAEDNIASEVIAAAMDAGLQVPEQVAVLGVRNDILVCEALPVPLSSIEYNMEEIGYQGAQILGRLLEGKSGPKETILLPPAGVVARLSTDVIAVEHEPTAAALNFIRNNFRYPIMVKDVAAASGMSQRGLVKAIKQHAGRTITDEIMRLRIDEACRLLEQTDEKTEVVAINSGFADKGTFFRCFKNQTGMTPNAYRKQSKSGKAKNTLHYRVGQGVVE